MNNKDSRSFYLSSSHMAWVKKWAKETDLPMSGIIELLIETAAPARMVVDGWGWRFAKIPTTADLGDNPEKCEYQKKGGRDKI